MMPGSFSRGSTALRLTDGVETGKDPATEVYVFATRQAATDFISLCGSGWRKKRVLTRTIRVAGITFDKSFVCLWSQR